MLSGGDRLSTCGFCAFLRCGMHSLLHRNVPRVLMLVHQVVALHVELLGARSG